MLASKASTLDEIAATTLVTAAKSRSTSEGARETLVGVARTPVKAPKARREFNAENRIEPTKQYHMINDCDGCKQRSSERRSVTTVTSDGLTAGEEISTQIDTSRYHPRTI
jgi:hypothetical protein